MENTVSYILTVVVGVAAAAITAWVQSRVKHPFHKELESIKAELTNHINNLTPRKFDVYNQQLDLLIEMLAGEKVGNDREDFLNHARIAKGLFLYASADAIRAYKMFRHGAGDKEMVMKLYATFAQRIRVDCGHNDGVGGLEFIELLLNEKLTEEQLNMWAPEV